MGVNGTLALGRVASMGRAGAEACEREHQREH